MSSTDNLTYRDNSAPAANLRFSVTGTILNATVSVYADGTLIGSATGVAGTTQVDTDGAYDLADAVHSMTARQTVGGVESGDSAALNITIDSVAPSMPAAPDLQAGSDTGVSNTDDITNDNTPTFDVSASPYFRFYRDGVLISGSYQSGATYTTATQADGTYAYVVSAVDAAGNESAWSSPLSATIDIVAPSAPVAPDLQAGSDTGVSNTDNITSDSTPTFDVSAAPYFRFYRAGVLISGNYESGASYTTAAQADGTYSYTLRAVDAAGNQSAASASLSVTIDSAAPAAPGAPDLQAGSDTGVSTADNITNDTTPTFDMAASPYFRFYRDGGLISGNYESGPTYTTATQADGTYSYGVRAVDAAGNQSALSSSLSVTIDTTAPSAPAAPDLQAASDTGVSNIDNVTNDNTPTFDVSASPYFRFYRDGVLISGNYQTGATYTTAVQADGIYAYVVSAVDAAGNESALSSPLSATIDIVAPSAPVAPDLQAASDTGVSSTDNITSDNTPTFDVSAVPYFRFYRAGVLISGNYESGATYTPALQADGTYAYTVCAVDAAGNQSAASASLSVTIDTAAPAAPGAPDLQAASDTGVSSTDNITNDNTPTFDVAALPYFRFYRDGALISGNYESGPTYTTATQADGTYSYGVRAVDAAGNQSALSSSLSVTIDTGAPSVPGAPDLQAASDSGVSNTDDVTNDDTPTFDVTASPYFRFYRDGALISGSYQSGATYTTVAQADATYGYALSAVDAAGNESALGSPLSVTINTAAPSVPGAPDLQAASDTGVSSTDNITSDNTPTFDVTAAPYFRFYRDGALISGNYESGATYTTAVQAAGTYSYAVTAVDAAGNQSALSNSLSVTIDTAAPAAPGAPDLQAASDTGVSSTDNITNDNTPTFDVAALPYFRFYRDGALISGNYESGPTYTTATQADGTYGYAVSAVDAAGNESALGSPLSVTIVAPSAPVAPDLQAASDTGVSTTDNITSDNTPTFDVTASPYFRFYRDGAQISGDYESATSYTLASQADSTYAYAVSAVDAAGNQSALSSSLSVTIDTVVPSAPPAPDLQAASDTGLSNTDNITRDNTPTFDVSASPYFRFYRDGVLISGNYQTGATYTTAVEADGTYAYIASWVDSAGNESALSSSLSVTIETVAPSAPPAPDLQDVSDTGISTDNVTADRTPAFDVVVPGGLYFRLYRSGALASAAPILADDGGVYKAGTSEELPEQPPGTFNYTARLIDVAGNQSASSAALQVQITNLWPLAWHEYEDGVFITIYDTDPEDGLSAPSVAWNRSEFQRGITDVLVDPGRPSDGIIQSVKLSGDGTNTADLAIMIEHNVGLQGFSDERTGTPPVGLLASEGFIGSMKLNNGIQGVDINGFTTEGGWTFSADIDEDGDTSDPTAIYSGRAVNTIRLVGLTSGDVVIAGTNDKGVSLGSFTVTGAGFHGDLVSPWSVGTISLQGDLNSGVRVGGMLGSLSIKGGGVSSSSQIEASALASLKVTGGDFAGTLDVIGDLSNLQVNAGNGSGGSLLNGQIHVGGLLQQLKVGGDIRCTNIEAGTLGMVTVKGRLGTGLGAPYSITDNAGPDGDDDLWWLVVGRAQELVTGEKVYLDS